MKELRVRDFFNEKKEEFALSVISDDKTLDNYIVDSQINRPGLALAGYLDRFSYKRIQILGETEISFLQTFKDDDLYDRVKEVFEFSIPCIIVSKGLSVPHQIEYLANEMKIAVLASRHTTNDLINGLSRYLLKYFAPKRTLHGTFVDVFGIGVMITGQSGIGKSECALDLVERGHRLIADDLVKIVSINDALIGTPANEDMGYFMEVRGVGIVDIEKMFGIQAVRRSKRIGIQVELMPWRDNMDYERIGLKNNFVNIHGVNLPVIYLPVSPGKNVSVIIEVIAMNHILKTLNYDAAEVFRQKLEAKIKRNTLMSKSTNR